jgi:ferredoxin-NADP reductase
MSSANIFLLKFLKKEHINKDIYCYFFDIQQIDFQFKSGQYIQMTLPHNNSDDRGTSRFFTIASSPTEKKYLMITSRKGKSSFKKTLFDLKPGTTVQFFGPIGTFVFA